MVDYNLTKEILSISKYGGEHKPSKRISGSMFNGELLQQFLRVKHGVLDNEEIGANTLGSIMHLGLEKLESDTIKVEQSYKLEKNNWTYSCTIDLIDTDKKVLGDFKLTKRYTYEKFTQDNSYAWQLRFNKFILKQLYPEFADYDMYVIMILKDFEASFKQEQLDPIQYIKVDEVDDEIIMDIIEKDSSLIDEHIKDNSYPEECSDVWWRKYPKGHSQAGKSYKSRCVKYCSYNKVCPYYKEPYVSNSDVMEQW